MWRRAQSNPSNPALTFWGGVSCYGHRPRSLGRRILYVDTAPTFSSGVCVTPTPTARSRAASSYVNTASVGPKRVSLNVTRIHTDSGGVPRCNAAPLPSITLGRCPSYTDAAPRLQGGVVLRRRCPTACGQRRSYVDSAPPRRGSVALTSTPPHHARAVSMLQKRRPKSSSRGIDNVSGLFLFWAVFLHGYAEPGHPWHV